MSGEVVKADAPPSATERLWPLAVRLGRVGLGAVIVLAANLLVIAVAVPVGLYLGRLFIALALGEGSLLLACAIAAITFAVRRRKGLGTGLFVGWATGYLGLIAAVAVFFLAILAISLGILAIWVLLWVVGGILSAIFGS
jgi:hypothetical protein